MEGVDAGLEAGVEEMMKITCRDWKRGEREQAGRQKERERERGHRGGCYIQHDEN